MHPVTLTESVTPSTDSLPMLLHDVSETCEILRCGRSTVYKLMKDGQLAVVKLGRRTLITRASIVALVEDSAS